MKKHGVIGFLLFALLSCAAQNAPSQQSLNLYDNFNHPVLDPLKWGPTGSVCLTSNGGLEECVRQIRDGKLHLGQRNYGNRDTDTGYQSGYNYLPFANPSTIKSITAEITLTNYSEVPCAANPQWGANARIDGVFFGTPNGDVSGHIGVGRAFSDPPDQLTVVGQIDQGGNFFFYLNLGTVKIGTPVNATLAWDQPNHQFLVSWTNLITNVTTNSTMPYGFADTAPPTQFYKAFTTDMAPANCTAAPSWVSIEATFDNVYVVRK